jgi:epoxyqueuosine reductase
VKNEEKNYSWLKEYSIKKGITLFGVANFMQYDRALNLSRNEIEGLIYAISLGLRLSPRVLAGIEDGPTDLYVHHYTTANMVLDSVAFSITNLIQKAGYNCLPIPASKTVDRERQQAHLSHKHIGVLAGHGWIGKNNLLVNPTYGSQVRYVTILTDLPLLLDHQIENDCGSCLACVEACPAESLGNSSEEYNFKRCFQKLDSFYKEKKLPAHICGICVKACGCKRN